MEKGKKCSNENHSKIDAINYCHECILYLCNKCSINHLELLKNHITYIFDKNIQDIFTGIYKE